MPGIVDGQGADLAHVICEPKAGAVIKTYSPGTPRSHGTSCFGNETDLEFDVVVLLILWNLT